jgi:hypothetical protein
LLQVAGDQRIRPLWIHHARDGVVRCPKIMDIKPYLCKPVTPLGKKMRKDDVVGFCTNPTRGHLAALPLALHRLGTRVAGGEARISGLVGAYKGRANPCRPHSIMTLSTSRNALRGS